MLRYFIYILSLTGLFFIACKPSGGTETASTSIDTTLHSPVAENDATTVLANPYAGYWISEAYLEELKKSGSPRKAQEGSEEVLLILPDSTGKASSLHYNFHEVNPELKLVSRRDTFYLDQEEGRDLPVVPRDENRIQYGSKSFVRFNGGSQGSNLLVLEPLVFEGKYKMNTGANVEFDDKGYIRGFKNYITYKPQLDYFDEGLQVDMIIFQAASLKPDTFAFSINKGKLELFELKCKTKNPESKRCAEVKAGKKLYSFTKL